MPEKFSLLEAIERLCLYYCCAWYAAEIIKYHVFLVRKKQARMPPATELRIFKYSTEAMSETHTG